MADNSKNKNRKYGRNKEKCKRYAANNKRDRNKVIKLKRHLKKFPHDNLAASSLDRLARQGFR